MNFDILDLLTLINISVYKQIAVIESKHQQSMSSLSKCGFIIKKIGP